MKWVLIGHRGTGKSSLLKRIEKYLTAEGMRFIDLDEEIERREGRSIHQIFRDLGEEAFRRIEVDVFLQVHRDTNRFVVALGAGFDLQAVPMDCTRIWVRRDSDEKGRIFLDRPRLETDVSQLEEFARRFSTRETKFSKVCDWIYTVPEGLSAENTVEKKLFTQSSFFDKAILTLMPWHIQKWKFWYPFYMNSDLTLEVRTDLLNVNEVLMTLSSLPRDKVLLSHRHLDWPAGPLEVLTDWSLELGSPMIESQIISKHELNGKSLDQALLELEQYARPGVHLKFAPIISSFRELDTLLTWQAEDLQNRSVLPRSLSGKWWWIRCLLKNRQQLNFVREGEGSSLDQPSIHQWLSLPQIFNGFAAVLGSPVSHSWTPMFHQEYFLAKRLPVLGVEIPEAEFSEAMDFLEKWGLVAAAVTSPLKEAASQWADDCSAKAASLEAVNTLINVNGVWLGENTDFGALKKILADVTDLSTVIWGGGGTLHALEELLPKAIAFSASKGRARAAGQNIQNPEVLIWAGEPRASSPENFADTQSWRPRLVLDLNYREDSLAREYALQVNASYLSGAEMFRFQARDQQAFWSRYL